MLRPLPALCIAVLVSVSISLAATALMGPAAPPAPPALRQGAPVTPEQLDRLHEELGDLRLLVEHLEQRLAAARRRPVARESAAGEPAATEEGATPLPSLLVSSDSDRQVFKDQVAQVLTELEEAEEEQRRLREVEESNKEYDLVEETLDGRLAGLQTGLGLTSSQASDLGSLLAVQNERNREMTRLWSEGAPQEDLDKRFAEYRAAHRREVMALLGPGQLSGYRRMLRDNHLGGRFSFFVGPWEGWSTPK